MAVQIYSKAFCGQKMRYESDIDIRNRMLDEVNKFLFNHDVINVVNIVEQWRDDTCGYDFLTLIIYYSK